MATGQIRSFLRLTNKEKLTLKVVKKERKLEKKTKGFVKILKNGGIKAQRSK